MRSNRLSPLPKKKIISEDDLVVQSSDMALINISTLASTGALDLSPRFQRRDRWERDRQSQLIESFILNVPVPPVYLAEEERGEYAVIDGKQRLTAIHQYLSNQFELTGLLLRPDLEGAQFSDLNPSLQRPLMVRPLRTVIILRNTPDWVKHEVFLRLNRGGQPLNSQEIRNVAFAGPLNDLFTDLATNTFLRQQLKIKGDDSPAYANMSDVETVTRFFAIADQWREFGGSFRDSLDKYMLTHYMAGPKETRQSERRFTRAIAACEDIWGDLAFRRHDGTQWRDQMLGAVYDAQMVSIDMLTDGDIAKLVEYRKRIVTKTERLFAEAEFDAAVRLSTNTPSRVRIRVERLLATLHSAL